MFFKTILLALFSNCLSYQFIGPSMNKLIGAAAIGSTMVLNKLDGQEPMKHPPIIRNINDFTQTTSISVQRNNIYLYGDITPQSCEELKNKLNELDFNGQLFRISYNSEPPPIHLHIQSTGGSLMNALYIVDLIENLQTKVITYVDGYSASAASLINVVGKERYMSKNSLVMIHQLSSGREGKYEELNDANENMSLLMNKIKTIYLKHTKIPIEILDEILKHDLWLDASKCKEYGLVDKII